MAWSLPLWDVLESHIQGAWKLMQVMVAGYSLAFTRVKGHFNLCCWVQFVGQLVPVFLDEAFVVGFGF